MMKLADNAIISLKNGTFSRTHKHVSNGSQNVSLQYSTI